MDIATWVKEELVLTMAARGSFGEEKVKKKMEVKKCDLQSQEKGDDHFTSHTIFVNLELKFEDLPAERHDVLVKVSPDDVSFKQYMETDLLFHNETLMYTQVLPIMEHFVGARQKRSVLELFPKCYYAQCGGDKDVVVLQDLRPLGFKVCDERVFLDYEHLAVAMRALGRFHAVSYGMKKLESDKFYSAVKHFKLPIFGDCEFYSLNTDRSIDYLVNRKELDDAQAMRLKNRLKNSIQLMKDFLTPKEPLSVLCHGDFCRNNMLFRYDDSGKPCDVKFFDLQTVKHVSPAIDLTFFIYLNTTAALRAQHWDDIFKDYHSSLLKSLADILECPEEELLPEYSLEKFKKEFVDYSLYGFMICSFFLPEMMAGPEVQINHDEASRGTLRDLTEMYLKIGGEAATRRVADIVKDLVARDAF